MSFASPARLALLVLIPLVVAAYVSAQRGRAAGAAFAEGFRQHLGHSYPQDNLLGELLGELLGVVG